MDGIKIPVEAKLEDGGADAHLQQFVKQFNALGETVAKANKLKFQPIDKATLDQVKAMNAQWDKLLKHPAFSGTRQRLKATDQTSAGFLDVDWAKTHPNEAGRRAAMSQAFQFVTGGGMLSAPAPSPTPPPTPAPNQPPRPPEAPPMPGPAPVAPQPPSQLAKIGRAAAGGAGGLGGVATTAIGEGQAFGMTAGLAGLAGGILALGVGKLVGMVREKVGHAQNELIGYDTLKRTLGDVNVSFGVLKDSLRQAARGVDLTFDDALRLGTSFTKLAGLTGEDHKKLGEEVGHAAGFSRSFGLDPAQGTAFFAQQRLYGVTKNVEESRRLGLLIGEGLAKAGVFSKADEVLEAISAFTEQQTRQGMTTANVSGYASFATGMMGSGIPGTDPASTASILSRVNASISGGGNAGEAGQNFMFSALGSPLGLNPIQAGILREQGAFGTGKATFGADSLYSEYSEAYGGKDAPAKAQQSTSTNLQMIMEKFDKMFKGRPDLMLSGMSNIFGTNLSQSMALATVQKKYGSEKLGGLADRLKRLGVNLNDVNDTGISRMASIEADTSLAPEEKDKRIREASSKNQEQTDGSRTRATINGVERAVQKMAEQLVSPINDIRGAVMFMAGEGGKRSPREILEAVAISESKDRANTITKDAGEKESGALHDASGLRRDRMAAQEALARGARTMKDDEVAKAQAHIADLVKKEKEAQERITTIRKERADALQGENDRRDRELRLINRNPDLGKAGALDWADGGSGAGRGRVNPELLGSTPMGETAADPAAGPAATPAAARLARRAAERAARGGVNGTQAAVAAAAKQEGLSEEQARLMVAISGQESSNDPNSPDSNKGAVGGMQMLPKTFEAYADKGWDIRNPDHNRRAAARYIKDLWKQAGGNPRTTAGAYYSGPSAIGPGGSLKERHDRDNPNFPSSLEYSDQIMARMRAASGSPLPSVDAKVGAAPVVAKKDAPEAAPATKVGAAPATAMPLPVDAGLDKGEEVEPPVGRSARSGTPLPEVLSREEAARARAATSTELPPEDSRRRDATGQDAARAAEVKVSGVFHLIGQDGQPKAAPASISTSIRSPSPAGVA